MAWLVALWKGHKAVILTVFAALVIVSVLAVVNHIYRKGEKAGASEVVKDVQGETIKKTEGARINKEKIDAETDKLPMEEILNRTR